MKNRPNFTNTIEEWSNFFIPLNDGVQLAARAWLPSNAIEQPVPAILDIFPIENVMVQLFVMSKCIRIGLLLVMRV